MERFIIAGGNKLEGSVEVDGAKNAVLPIMGATLLTGGTTVIHKAPQLIDVRKMARILEHLGTRVTRDKDTLTIKTDAIHNNILLGNLMGEMRASVFLLGALIGRFLEATIAYPGGCAIGTRPIDLHLRGLRSLGVTIKEKNGNIEAKADKLVGAEIYLDYPSVGATENVMLVAVKAEGESIIRNAAKEPEIVDLQNFLNAMGAKVSGAGTDTISIWGVKDLYPVEYTIMPDRIVAGTLVLATCAVGGDVELRGVNPSSLLPLILKARDMGARITCEQTRLRVVSKSRLKAIENTKTFPYPGFSTDLQAPLVATLCQAQGISVVTETVFESRFNYVTELHRLGARIKIDGSSVIIQGVPRLQGAVVRATDLRAGAALVIAGVMAEGLTIVEDIHHIDRGYAHLEQQLTQLGVSMERIGY